MRCGPGCLKVRGSSRRAERRARTILLRAHRPDGHRRRGDETMEGGLTEIRMSDAILQATLALRQFLFEAVYENDAATAEFKKATGILGGLWEKVRRAPARNSSTCGRSIGRPRCGRPRFRRGHDRSLCGAPVRRPVRAAPLDRDQQESSVRLRQRDRDQQRPLRALPGIR